MRRLAAVALAVALLSVATSCARPAARLLKADFVDVGDLVVRANVQSSDAVVGTVRAIDLVDDPRGRGWLARVTMELGPDVRVVEGSRAVVRSTSLLGEKFVDLDPPDDERADARPITDGAVLPLTHTGKAPELEEVFTELGAILASGALTDLGALVTAQARILEGQEEDVGRVLDGSAKVLSSLAEQRQDIAHALDSLRTAAGTLAAGGDTTDRFLRTTAETLRILAEQKGQVDQLVVQLDRFSDVLARLLREHRDEVDRQIKALLEILPKVHEARETIDSALPKVGPFARLFARAIPGDYVQLDITFENPAPVGPSAADAFERLWWPAAGSAVQP